MATQPNNKIIISQLSELGSPIEWQACIDQALADTGLEEIPEQKMMLRYFVVDALRVQLEKKFNVDDVERVIDAILKDLGGPPRDRRRTIEGARNAQHISAKITLPSGNRQRATVVQTLGMSNENLETISKLVPRVQLHFCASSLDLMEAAGNSPMGGQVFLVDARVGIEQEALDLLLGVLSEEQTIIWVNDPKEFGLSKHENRVICDASVGIDDIAALLRVAFFSQR